MQAKEKKRLSRVHLEHDSIFKRDRDPTSQFKSFFNPTRVIKIMSDSNHSLSLSLMRRSIKNNFKT